MTQESQDEAVRRASRKRKAALKRWFGRGLLFLSVAGLLGLLAVSFMPQPVPVDVTEVTRGSFVVSVTEDGQTRVKDRYVVSAPIAGNLARITLHAGDAVEDGAVLGRILPMAAPLLDARTRAQSEARVLAAQASQRQARASIGRAEAALELAQSQASRREALAQSGAVTTAVLEAASATRRARAEELTSARFGARVADYEVRMARAALSRMGGDAGEQFEVTSPIDGRVLRVIQSSAGVVGPGTPLVEVGNPAALEVVVDVLTNDAVQIHAGAQVELLRWGGDHPLRGHVRLIEPSAFSRVSALGVQEQRVNIVIDLDSPREQWQALGDGYRIQASVRIFEEDAAVQIPASAAFRHEGAWAVYLLRDGKAKLVPVEVGRRGDLMVQILAGLEPGQKVIVHPSDRVADGVDVALR